jgi:hypothetical protein
MKAEEDRQMNRFGWRVRPDLTFFVVALIGLWLLERSGLGSPWTAGELGVVLVWAVGHCDGMDGPVITLAKRALETGNVNLVLGWVRAEDEADIRRAFNQAASVRGLNPQARALADRHFFETLVRIHRAGEGAPFTGLKPAGRDLGPAVPAADRALEGGSIDEVVALVTNAVRDGIHERFAAAMRRKDFDPDDVAASRAYVEAYVRYVHYVERLWDTARPGGHDPHAAPAAREERSQGAAPGAHAAHVH